MRFLKLTNTVLAEKWPGDSSQTVPRDSADAGATPIERSKGAALEVHKTTLLAVF